MEEATNGAEAMAVIGRSRPHAIIAEITLPGSSRLATIFASDRYVPVIVTTTDDAMAVPPGKASVLVKPFPLATMLDELRHALAPIRIAAGGVLGAVLGGPPPVRPGQP